MLSPVNTIPLARYSESSFLSNGIPDVVIHAQRYMRLVDTRTGPEPVRKQATLLLQTFKEELQRPGSDLPRTIMSACMHQVAYERKQIPQPVTSAPAIISEEMKSKTQISPRSIYYGSITATVPPYEQQLLQFQGDLIKAVEHVFYKASSVETYDKDTAKTVLDLAAFVSNYFERVADQRKLLKDTIRPADRFAAIIGSCQGDATLVARFCVSLFSQQLKEPLGTAAELISKRLAAISPKLGNVVLAAAQEPPLLSLAALSEDQKRQLRHDLNAPLSQPELVQRSLMLPSLYSADRTLRGGHALIKDGTPEWLRIFARQGRLDTRDFAAFSEASEKLKASLGTATTVSIDIGLFAWPRITEIAAISRPREIVLCSDLPRHSGSDATAPVTRTTAEALAVRSDFALPFLSLAPSADSVMETERRWLQPVEIRDLDASVFSYECAEGVRKAQLSFRSHASVAERISGFLNGKPITAPCFIIEGASANAPRAFGVLFDKLERDASGYSREKLDGITVYIAQSEAVRRAQPRPAQATEQPPARKSVPPISPAPTITISDEMKLEAMAALDVAQRYGIEGHAQVQEPLKLVQQVLKGQCPSRKALRVRLGMRHNWKQSVVTGGVAAFYERALPLLDTLADEVEQHRPQAA